MTVVWDREATVSTEMMVGRDRRKWNGVAIKENISDDGTGLRKE